MNEQRTGLSTGRFPEDDAAERSPDEDTSVGALQGENMKVVNLITDYEVANGDVRISVVVGEAQIGSSIIKLGKKVLAKGDIADVLVGKGSAIKGKPLYVKSVVTDVNDNTNRTSVKYEFKGGRKDQDFVSSGTVDEDGDSIIYRAKFNLV